MKIGHSLEAYCIDRCRFVMRVIIPAHKLFVMMSGEYKFTMLVQGSAEHYGSTAAAPVVGLGRIEIWSSDGPSTIGSPASARSVFQRIQLLPPAVSMSSWKIVEDHLLLRLKLCFCPSAKGENV
jgi:hypothetical protein